MEGKFSKVVFAVLALALSGIATTVTAHTKCGFPSMVPSNQARYHIGLTGLYVRMSNDDLLYATQSKPDNVFERHYADPKFCYGGRLNLGYLIPNTGNDLTLNGTCISSDDSFRKTNEGNVFAIPDRFQTFNEVNSKVDFDFKEVNIEIGQKVDFCSLHSRFHLGLSYACIDHEFRILANGVVANTTSKYKSEFSGYGPRFGIDLTYPLGGPCSSFAFVGQFSGSILYSTTCFTAVHQRVNLPGGPEFNDRSKYDDVCTVTPAGTMRLGLEYTTNPDSACGGFTVGAGWEATGYYYSIIHGQVNSNQQNAKNSNFFYNGYYLAIEYSR